MLWFEGRQIHIYLQIKEIRLGVKNFKETLGHCLCPVASKNRLQETTQILADIKNALAEISKCSNNYTGPSKQNPFPLQHLLELHCGLLQVLLQHLWLFSTSSVRGTIALKCKCMHKMATKSK